MVKSTPLTGCALVATWQVACASDGSERVAVFCCSDVSDSGTLTDVIFRIIQDLHFGAHLFVSATHLVCVFVLQHQRLQSHPDAERESRRVHGCLRDARMRRVVDDHGSGSKVGAFRAHSTIHLSMLHIVTSNVASIMMDVVFAT